MIKQNSEANIIKCHENPMKWLDEMFINSIIDVYGEHKCTNEINV